VEKPPAAGKGEFRGTLNGTLTLHGKTGPVGLAIQGLAGADRFDAAASTTFKQSDFGIKPYKTALGTISVKDEVSIEITIVAIPAGKK
jgi:polyisoprenoid-binding protein YceI